MLLELNHLWTYFENVARCKINPMLSHPLATVMLLHHGGFYFVCFKCYYAFILLYLNVRWKLDTEITFICLFTAKFMCECWLFSTATACNAGMSYKQRLQSWLFGLSKHVLADVPSAWDPDEVLASWFSLTQPWFLVLFGAWSSS